MVHGSIQMVTYVSQSCTAEDDQVSVMRQLSDTIQARNAELGITGVLFLRGSIFVQYLEGPVDAVKRLMDSIKSDPRHSSVYVLLNEQIDTRRFKTWSMACFHDPGCSDGFQQTLFKFGEAIWRAGAFDPSTLVKYCRRLASDMARYRIAMTTDDLGRACPA